MQTREEIRLALPSKGRLADEALDLFERAGLRIYKPNPRQYKASIPALPGLVVLFQRPGDILFSIRDGSVDFGITGWDIYSDRWAQHYAINQGREILVLLNELRIGACTLNVIVPENQDGVQRMTELRAWGQALGRPLRVATKFPVLTQAFFSHHDLEDIQLISSEGTLEIAPTIGYADLIVDLISTGTTLRDNRLMALEDGLILQSQGCLIANRAALKQRSDILAMARQLMEFLVAYLRAAENVSIFANMRGDSAQSVAENMFSQQVIGGLQGPTISPVITRRQENWYAVHLIVRKDQLAQAIQELRQVGGSGVVVAPVMYIFEEEPQAYRELAAELEA